MERPWPPPKVPPSRYDILPLYHNMLAQMPDELIIVEYIVVTQKY